MEKRYGRMPMTPMVKVAMWVLRVYVVVMVGLVVYRLIGHWG